MLQWAWLHQLINHMGRGLAQRAWPIMGVATFLTPPPAAAQAQARLAAPEKMKTSIKLVDEQMNWCDSALEVWAGLKPGGAGLREWAGPWLSPSQ